jgi:DNA-directed RNA polymerase beta' subunit
LDVLLSSTGVVTRLNPAQVLETSLARVAEKTGKPIVVENFADRDNVAWVKGLLKKHGIKERETVFDPLTGKKIENILVGPQYIHKLFKTTETNYSARGVEDYDVNEQPSTGGPKGSKGLGRMEVNALIGHDARNILREAAVLKSQRNDEYWRALQLGLPLPPLKPTFAYDKFGTMLVGAGIKPNKSGDIVTLGPLTDRDVTRLSAGRITKPLLVRAKDLRPEKDGLFSPGITGGSSGKLWSHIDLQEPVVNPTFERPVKTFLGLKQKDFNQLVREEGGRGISRRLAAIDIKKREAEVLNKLKSARATTRDNLIKELKYVRGLKKSGLSPQDAYIMKKIPVIPPIFRQIFPGRKGDLRIADSNYLYRDAMLADEALAKSKDLPVSVQQDARKHLYNSVAALYGHQEPVSPQIKSRGAMGFIQQLAGLSPRSGFFQSKLLRRRQEPAGRGTISPDQNLAMDEVGLPEEMIWDMFTPFITRRLVQRGHKAVAARDMIKERSPVAREELLHETRERPVIVNRAPSLHRHNMVAAYPKPVPGATIRIPEFLAPPLGADFDGDAVQIHAPVTPEAVHEAKSLTLKNQIFGDRNKQTLLSQPQHESIMGLYAATQPAKGKKRVFKSRAEALAAYHRGEIALTTPVEIRK